VLRTKARDFHRAKCGGGIARVPAAGEVIGRTSSVSSDKRKILEASPGSAVAEGEIFAVRGPSSASTFAGGVHRVEAAFGAPSEAVM